MSENDKDCDEEGTTKEPTEQIRKANARPGLNADVVHSSTIILPRYILNTWARSQEMRFFAIPPKLTYTVVRLLHQTLQALHENSSPRHWRRVRPGPEIRR